MVKKPPRGQVFLVDNEVLRRIADVARLAPDETVVEIGMGHGELTQHLVRRAAEVVAVELEERFVEEAAAAFARWDNLTIVHGNFLDVEWREVVPAGRRVVVVGNVPFYITSPILRRLFGHRADVLRWSLLMQREVAARICAPAGADAYGALSVKMQFWGRPELALVVPAAAFEPVPEVDAAVVTYYYYDDPAAGLARPELFDPFVDFIFGGRRKKLANRLATLLAGERGGEELTAMLAAAGFDADVRPERLGVADFTRLFVLAEPLIKL